MRKIEEMIEVMNAYKDGKKIEYKNDGYWEDCEYPTWDWFSNSYRVKPEPPQKKIVPYESAEEFLAAQKEHGPYFRFINDSDYYYIPLLVGDNAINIDDAAYGYEGLSVKCVWQDGHAVGKEILE